MHMGIIRIVAGAVALLLAGTVQAALQAETVEYDVGGSPHTGYLVHDDAFEGQRPGVLVVHEWWGHDQFVREQAEALARAGYTAFALDMYGSGKLADHPEDAQALMSEAISDPEMIEHRFRRAMEVLQAHETVDEGQLAAQGYCFGGAVVLNMARRGLDLAGVVSYHGSLGSPFTPEPGSIQARIQVYTGGADPLVPLDQVTAFIEEMHSVGADVTLRSFPAAQHSFMNPRADEFGERFGMPLAYDEDAAMNAWAGTLAFYRELFGQ